MPIFRDPSCHCLYKKSEHTELAKKNYQKEDTKWKVHLNTQPVPTNAYGEIEFVGYGQKLSKVRTSSE